jgi:hypothetical protein
MSSLYDSHVAGSSQENEPGKRVGTFLNPLMKFDRVTSDWGTATWKNVK